MRAVVDNDVLFKSACYMLLDDLLTTVCSCDQVGVLGAAKFVVLKRLEKSNVIADKAAPSKVFRSFLDKAQTLEPTPSEQETAAELELAAQKMGLGLDSGESQLCAIVVHRFVPWLFTGDKRAVVAMEKLLDTTGSLATIQGRVLCLEQLFFRLVSAENHEGIRSSVCGAIRVDTAVSISFACNSQASDVANTKEGLGSYIEFLRKDASRVLAG